MFTRLRLVQFISVCLILITQQAGAQHLEDIAPYIPKMNVQAGSAIAVQKCSKCHSFDKGVYDKSGPSLWGVYNRPIASVPGYEYSSILKKMRLNKWTYQELNQYLFNSGIYAPGTKMPYVSLRDTQERTNLIGWLSTLYDNTLNPAQRAAMPITPYAPAPPDAAPKPSRQQDMNLPHQ